MSENLASEIEFDTSETGCRSGLSMGRLNKFKQTLNHFLSENRGFKKIMLTLSLLEPCAFS